MSEGCGIVGIALDEGDAVLPIFYALYALQHRGQESAGIAVSKSKSKEEESGVNIPLIKGMGFVYEVFSLVGWNR